YHTAFETCAGLVGAGLPAKGPAQRPQIRQAIALSRQMAQEQLFQRLQRTNPLLFLVNFPTSQ
ncbi:hypothetical protein, partial [Pseudomonas sp. C5pp]|uniref:hypothetical protein n=1 Tax=Pseudomonas sp. C5pp TaxID=1586081 RepID=UPI001F1E3A2C